MVHFNTHVITNRARRLGLSLIVAVMPLLATPVQATSPTDFDVVGNTITFNFSDWYQVQDSLTYESLCEGNDPCVVPDGVYFVINHTIQQRYTVKIGETGGGSTEVLNFPDDGWYQVQNAETYESICDGLSSCEVEPGRYIIINHTTGVRTERVVTGGTSAYSDFNIDGNAINFTADGWFQVQDQDTYQTLCEGTSSCELSNGYYQVTNHSTGQRWMDVFIEGSTGVEPTINSGNYRAIVKQALEVFSGQAFDDRLALFPYFLNSDFTGNSRTQLTLDCDNGGTHDQYLLLTPSSINKMEAQFRNCLWSKGALGNGDRLDGRIGDTYSPGGHDRFFLDFNATISGQARMEVDGQHRTGCCGSGAEMETNNLDYYFSYPEGSLRVTNANTYFNRSSIGGNLEGSFTMQTDVTDLQDVFVESEQPLTYDLASVGEQGDLRYLHVFNSGILKLTAPGDGSSVTIDAGTGDFTTVSVLISSGTESLTISDTWRDWRDALACTRERCEFFSIPGEDVPRVNYF